MSDYRLIIRVKNNLLHERMKERGIESQSELARVIGCSPSDIGHVANLRVGAFNADGRPSTLTKKLCDYFGCLPEDVYPAEVLHVGIPRNEIERIVSSEEVAKYIKQTEIGPEYQLENMIDSEFIEKELNRLKPREKKVIKLRFYDEKSLDETAKELGVTRERIRQIEAMAIRRLRIPMKFDSEIDKTDKTSSGLSTRFSENIKKYNERMVR